MTTSGDRQGGEAPGADIRDGDQPALPGRPWLQVYFRCSGQYQRVYRNARGDLYIARCTKCGQSIRFAVGPGGTDRRFFEVSC